jgi:hypothetical protein
MRTVADHIIDAAGGTTKVATLTKAPLSTVHSWRKIGIPSSRFDHLKLAAAAADLDVDLDAVAEAARKAGAPETAPPAKPPSDDEARQQAAA